MDEDDDDDDDVPVDNESTRMEDKDGGALSVGRAIE